MESNVIHGRIDNIVVHEGPLPGCYVFNTPKYSNWQCNMFGGGPNGICWTPLEGKEPNWFWRWMQYICFGNKWIKKSA